MNRLLSELICIAHGAEMVDYSENLAIDKDGELIMEAKVVAKVSPLVSEITITLGKKLDDEQI